LHLILSISLSIYQSEKRIPAVN